MSQFAGFLHCLVSQIVSWGGGGFLTEAEFCLWPQLGSIADLQEENVHNSSFIHLNTQEFV